MQVDNEGGSEITATTTDRAPEEDPANTPATTGVTGEGHENGNVHPSTSPREAEEAQEDRDYHNTESPLEDGSAETQVNNTAELDEHGTGGTFHSQSAATSGAVDNPFENEGISPTVPFTHPDASSITEEAARTT